MTTTVFTTITSTNTPVLGPLTTVFTPPASCADIYYSVGASGIIAIQAVTCSTDSMYHDDSSCFPSTASGSPHADSFFAYSPALSCPLGFYTACLSTAGVAGSCSVWPTLQPGETGAACCSLGFTGPIESDQLCYRNTSAPVSSPTGFTLNFPQTTCLSDGQPSVETIVLPTFFPANTTTNGFVFSVTSTQSFWYINAVPIQMRWQLTDLTTSAQIASTTSMSAPSTSTPRSITPASTSSTSSPTPAPPSGLSTGASAGIGVGVGVGGILLILGAWLLWSRRRKRGYSPAAAAEAGANDSPQMARESFEKSELPPGDVRRSEMADNPQKVAEAGDNAAGVATLVERRDPAVAEMSGEGHVHELGD